jgi:serine/threonine protein kinase
MSAELRPADKLVGQVLADRYQILHRLGEGAMGVVYKARHVKVGRLFAVKVLHPRALEDAKVAQRFAREAELAGRLRHPNVVGVVDVGELEGTRYMVMEFAEGPDLAKLLDEAPMRAERIIRLVRQMLEGLYHAHEQGLIHRDFKPENVIVECDSNGAEMPRIVDFGIALLREGSGSGDGMGRLTTNGLVLGTPHYMAPEQAVADPIDHRIDLFALGIVIYEMLSGRLPFDGGGAEVARANLLLDPPMINRRVPHLEVDPLLEAFARRLMAKRREARPATAKAARELLDLIESDRKAAAAILGVPTARSGRTPAVTEPVAPEEPSGPTERPPETVRLRSTPRPAPPVAHGMPDASAVPATDGFAAEPGERPDVVPGQPPGELAPPFAPGTGAPGTGAPGTGFPPGPGMVYPGPLARPGGGGAFGPPRGSHGPHRDTALRTPLGWQTDSLPSRRRSWLIVGAAIGAACLIVAVTLWSTSRTQDQPADGDRVATFAATRSTTPAIPTNRDSSAAVAPAETHRTPEPAVTGTPAVVPAAVGSPTAPNESGGVGSGAAGAPDSRNIAMRGASSAGVAVGSPHDDEHRRNPPPSPRKAGGVPSGPGSTAGRSAAGGSRVSGAPSAEPGGASERAPATREPATREPREPAAREPATREPREPAAREPSKRESAAREPSKREPATDPDDARSPRSDAPRTSSPKKQVGISAVALHALYDTVWTEIVQLPPAKKSDLTSQMLVFKINDAMQGSESERDRSATQLSRILEEARRRKAQ